MDLPSAFRAPSPGSPSSATTLSSLQHRSFSLPSLSSSASSPSDRQLSPLSPCDRDRAGTHRPKLQLPPMLPMLPLPSPQLKHQTTDPHDHQADSNKKQRQLSFSSSTCSSPRLASLSSPALSSSLSPSLSRQQRHHPYSTYSYYPPTPSSSSPRVMYQQHSHSSQDQDRSSSQYYHNLPSSGSDYFQPRFPYHHSQPFATPQEEEREPTVILPHLRTPSSSHSDLHSLYHHHGHNSNVAPKLEEHEMGLTTFLRSMKTLSSPYTCSSPSTPMPSSSRHRSHHRHENDMEVEDDDEGEDQMESDEEDEHSSQSSRSRSTSLAFGNMSEASASMTSLTSASSYSSSSPSPTPVPSTTTTTTNQLLMCPVCSRAFKPSKNQNCNLRRHLKNVHNMSPTMHPRKCKWDSLPDGRVKDDKDRKERTRKSKRIWAQKFRQRRKVEEAAVVLSMLSQAV